MYNIRLYGNIAKMNVLYIPVVQGNYIQIEGQTCMNAKDTSHAHGHCSLLYLLHREVHLQIIKCHNK